MSTDRVTVTDPAAATDQASTMFALNVFQRLMTSAPGAPVLKPDAARDCGFIESPTIYTCTLQKDLTFAGGDPLTASDVKFSIERRSASTSRAAPPPCCRPCAGSTPPTTSPCGSSSAGSTTSSAGRSPRRPPPSSTRSSTTPTDVRGNDQLAVGSGPFVVTSFDEAAGKPGSITFSRFPDYRGFTPATIDEVTYRTVADSATIEDAMSKGQVDVVWRGSQHRRRHPGSRSRSAAARTRPRAAASPSASCPAPASCSCSGRRARGPGGTRRCARPSRSPCRATGRRTRSSPPASRARPRRSRSAARSRPR